MVDVVVVDWYEYVSVVRKITAVRVMGGCIWMLRNCLDHTSAVFAAWLAIAG